MNKKRAEVLVFVCSGGPNSGNRFGNRAGPSIADHHKVVLISRKIEQARTIPKFLSLGITEQDWVILENL